MMGAEGGLRLKGRPWSRDNAYTPPSSADWINSLDRRIRASQECVAQAKLWWLALP